MKSMGERIRHARTEAGLTPEQLTQRCGVDPAAMAQWEAVDPQGYERPSLDNLRIIARETGQSVDKVEKDTDRNYWMTAEEAKEYGLVSHIVESTDKIK